MICSLSVALQISRSMHGELNHDGGSGVVWAHYISLGKAQVENNFGNNYSDS